MMIREDPTVPHEEKPLTIKQTAFTMAVAFALAIGITGAALAVGAPSDDPPRQFAIRREGAQ